MLRSSSVICYLSRTGKIRIGLVSLSLPSTRSFYSRFIPTNGLEDRIVRFVTDPSVENKDYFYNGLLKSYIYLIQGPKGSVKVSPPRKLLPEIWKTSDSNEEFIPIFSSVEVLECRLLQDNRTLFEQQNPNPNFWIDENLPFIPRPHQRWICMESPEFFVRLGGRMKSILNPGIDFGNVVIDTSVVEDILKVQKILQPGGVKEILRALNIVFTKDGIDNARVECAWMTDTLVEDKIIIGLDCLNKKIYRSVLQDIINMVLETGLNMDNVEVLPMYDDSEVTRYMERTQPFYTKFLGLIERDIPRE